MDGLEKKSLRFEVKFMLVEQRGTKADDPGRVQQHRPD